MVTSTQSSYSLRPSFISDTHASQNMNSFLHGPRKSSKFKMLSRDKILKRKKYETQRKMKIKQELKIQSKEYVNKM